MHALFLLHFFPLPDFHLGKNCIDKFMSWCSLVVYIHLSLSQFLLARSFVVTHIVIGFRGTCVYVSALATCMLYCFFPGNFSKWNDAAKKWVGGLWFSSSAFFAYTFFSEISFSYFVWSNQRPIKRQQATIGIRMLGFYSTQININIQSNTAAVEVEKTQLLDKWKYPLK